MGRNANGGVHDEHPTGERQSSKLKHRAPLTVPSNFVRTLATLGKPLIREFLFYPCQRLSKLVGSGLCVTREPRLPRSDVRCICSLTSSALSTSHEELSSAKR